MKLKLFLLFFGSLLALFPANIFGCGGDYDPYDYFTSFFSRKLVSWPGAGPFFYNSNLLFFQEDVQENKVPLKERIIGEWNQYAPTATREDVAAIVYDADITALENIKKSIDNPGHYSMADSNSFARSLVKNKDLLAVDYLVMLRTSDNFAFNDEWSPRTLPDSMQLIRLEMQAKQKMETARPFIKQRLAFYAIKTAFYNGRHEEVGRLYESFFAAAPLSSIQQLALSYHAGSLFRSGKHQQAAKAFSRLFTDNVLEREKIYLGFLWSTHFAEETYEDEFTGGLATVEEKANMLALFGLHGTGSKLETLKKVYQLDKNHHLLPLLISREIHKLEEQYFSVALYKEDAKSPYGSWGYSGDLEQEKVQLVFTKNFLREIAAEPTQHQAFITAAAAHLHFIDRDFAGSSLLLDKLSKMKLSAAMKDQLQLGRLLIQINQPENVDAVYEQQLLPSLNWLVQKAAADEEYQIFARNLFAQLLAPRYQKVGDKAMAALVLGVSNKVFDSYYASAVDYLREEMDIKDVLRLYGLLTKTAPGNYEKFLISNSLLKKQEVIDMIGTAYLREHKFARAIEWFQKSGKEEILEGNSWDRKEGYVDPFYDYVNDSERFDRMSKTPWTKLSFARKLLELEQQIPLTKDKEQKARLYYKLASGLYNMSYYGNAYDAVVYYRPSTKWNTGNYKAEWESEYFGVYKAKSYYQKAYELTSNREFKAACFFLVLKCDQRQVIFPFEYGYFSYSDSAWKKFKYNRMFPEFIKQFGNTKYYSYVFDRCSYLQDFVN